DAETRLFDGQLQLADLKRAELTAIVRLYRALGGGWSPVVPTAGAAASRWARLLVGGGDPQAALVAEESELRVRTLGQLVGHLDRLPLEELGADPPRDDRLKVGDALPLYALALGLLPLAVEHELHPLRLLLGLELFLDRRRQQLRQLHGPQ